MLKLVEGLAFRTSKFYIAPYSKINCRLVNLSYNCDVKLGLKFASHTVCLSFFFFFFSHLNFMLSILRVTVVVPIAHTP